MKLKKVCAACGKFLGGTKKSKRVSHGYCLTCANKQLSKAGLPPLTKHDIKNPISKNKALSIARSRKNNPSKTSNTARSIFEKALNDPFIYQRILIPAWHRLEREFKQGSFSKRKWLRAMIGVANHAVRTLERETGKKYTLKDKIRAAYGLAKYAWELANRGTR